MDKKFIPRLHLHRQIVNCGHRVFIYTTIHPFHYRKNMNLLNPLRTLMLLWAIFLPQAYAAGDFIKTGSMIEGRHGHTALQLPNGKVLVAGGYGFDTQLSRAELYDQSSGAWSRTGAMKHARNSHTATLLPNGKVLVAGGYSENDALASAELYNPATGTWSQTGSMYYARSRHTATLLPNGRVLVAGGAGGEFGELFSSAELYDSTTGKWITTGPMSYYYEYHTATLLKGGKVLVTGGGDDKTRAELYDPTTKMWSTTRSMNEARIAHSATLLPNGKVLVAGGDGLEFKSDASSSAELYDPAIQSWSLTGSMAYGRVCHTALLANGRVMVAGGWSNSFSGDGVSSVEFYDSTTGTWSSAASMGNARALHTSTPLSGGKVLMAGGWGDDISKSSAELYREQPIKPIITSDLSPASFPKGKLIPRFAITTNFGAKTFSATGLPKGLTLNMKNGIISGKPTKIQTCTVTLIAKKMKGKKVEQQATATKVIIVF
jgi:hypothetical protein